MSTDEDSELSSAGARTMSISATSMEVSDLMTDVVRHSKALTALEGQPRTHEELQRCLDVSRSTCYRYTNRLEERDMVGESGEAVHLTALGETVTDEVSTFRTRVTETLRPDDKPREVLDELLKHAAGLQAISRRPIDRRELEDRLGVSDTTGYRITRSLEDRGLIEKEHGRYAITDIGREVLAAVSTFEANLRTAVRLGPVLRAVRESGPSVDLDAFADATVTTLDGLTHSPQNRFLNLGDDSDTFRGINTETIAGGHLVDIQQNIRDGQECEVLIEPKICAEMLAEYPEEAIEACRSPNVSIYLHPDLWYCLAIFDERIGIGVLDAETGVCRAFVDTDSAAARRWAEAVYDSYMAEAVYLPQFDPFTLQQVQEKMTSGTAQAIERL